jgi:hypothetical protein
MLHGAQALRPYHYPSTTFEVWVFEVVMYEHYDSCPGLRPRRRAGHRKSQGPLLNGKPAFVSGRNDDNFSKGKFCHKV